MRANMGLLISLLRKIVASPVVHNDEVAHNEGVYIEENHEQENDMQFGANEDIDEENFHENIADGDIQQNVQVRGVKKVKRPKKKKNSDSPYYGRTTQIPATTNGPTRRSVRLSRLPSRLNSYILEAESDTASDTDD